MGYFPIGIIAHSDIMCIQCAYNEWTEEEVDALLAGKRAPFYAPRWPRKEDGEYVRDEETNEIIFDEDVTVRGKWIPRDREGRIEVYLGDDDNYDGWICDCGYEIEEPYKLNCTTCGEVAVSGDKAAKLDYDFKSSEIYCEECYGKLHKDMLKGLVTKLEETLVALYRQRSPFMRFMGTVVPKALGNLEPKIGQVMGLIERAKSAERADVLLDELVTDLDEAAYFVWKAPHKENVDILELAVEALQNSIYEIADNECVEFDRIAECQEKMQEES